MVMHENSLKNLVEIQTRPKEEQVAIQSKGGSVVSESKSLARKLSWMKRKGMTDPQVQELHDMLTNEDVSDLTILNYIKTLKDMADTDGDFNKVKSTIDLLLKWRKERFGSKLNIEGTVKVDWGDDVSRILDGCKVVDAEFTEVEQEVKQNE